MNEAELFRFNNKQLRSGVIKAYMQRHGFDKAVCFSCGNASRMLKEAGVKTLDISLTGDMQANRWFSIGEIKAAFPSYFDATSGHLPMDCMKAISDAFYFALYEKNAGYYLSSDRQRRNACMPEDGFPENKNHSGI